MMEEFLWCEKYRPTTVKDTILPPKMKATFQKFVDQKNIPTLILTGGPGVGKTTIARAMCEEIGSDYIILNSQLDATTGALRDEIRTFAATVSMNGGRKYIILDEADYLNAQHTQPALRNFIETYSNNCGFILTCNHINKIIEAIHSRNAVVDFTFDQETVTKLAGQFFKRAQAILTNEGVEFEKETLGAVIQKYYPDWRRTLNQLQYFSTEAGKIDSSVLKLIQKQSISELVELMKDKNFTGSREWVRENASTDYVSLYNEFYDTAEEFLTKDGHVALCPILARYMYQHAFAANPEINFLGFLVEVMVEVEFQ